MLAHYENNDSQMFRLDKLGNMNVAPHMHKHPEVIYILAGEIAVTVDGRERLLCGGDAALCFPNCVHSLTSKSDGLMFILIVDIQLTGDFAKMLLKYTPEDPFIPKERIHPDLPRCLDTIYALFDKFFDMEEDRDYHKLVVKGYLQVIFARLMAAVTLTEADDAAFTALIKNALDYILKNFKDSALSLRRLADHLKVSDQYLSAVFSRKVGTSYSKYLNSCRILYARQQIIQTELPIRDIAKESGFTDIRNFNRVFKKVTGITPSECRGRHMTPGK